MNFIATLKGIGVAYSRNIFMDLYHDDFINSIKIDHRLKQLLKELEADTSLSYCEYEEEFISIATDAKSSEKFIPSASKTMGVINRLPNIISNAVTYIAETLRAA